MPKIALKKIIARIKDVKEKKNQPVKRIRSLLKIPEDSSNGIVQVNGFNEFEFDFELDKEIKQISIEDKNVSENDIDHLIFQNRLRSKYGLMNMEEYEEKRNAEIERRKKNKTYYEDDFKLPEDKSDDYYLKNPKIAFNMGIINEREYFRLLNIYNKKHKVERKVLIDKEYLGDNEYCLSAIKNYLSTKNIFLDKDNSYTTNFYENIFSHIDIFNILAFIYDKNRPLIISGPFRIRVLKISGSSRKKTFQLFSRIKFYYNFGIVYSGTVDNFYNQYKSELFKSVLHKNTSSRFSLLRELNEIYSTLKSKK